jgi:hypothetical protein
LFISLGNTKRNTNFKISAGGGKSKGISSSISIWIGSTESTNKKAGDDTDKNKFTLSGTALTFEATDFNKDDGGNSNNYPVTIRATRDS